MMFFTGVGIFTIMVLCVIGIGTILSAVLGDSSDDWADYHDC